MDVNVMLEYVEETCLSLQLQLKLEWKTSSEFYKNKEFHLTSFFEEKIY